MAAKRDRKERYMHQKNGIWHFRIMVPKHLREKYGTPEYNHSLGTRDFEAAHRKAMNYMLFYKRMFDSGEVPNRESHDYTPEDVKQTAAKHGVEFHTPEEVEAASVDEAVEMRSSALLAHKRTKKVTKLEVMAFGGVMPPMTMTQALNHYMEIKADRVLGMDHRDAQKKWNPFKEAVKRFEKQMGKMDVQKITKADAIKYKTHLIGLVKNGELKSDSANGKMKWLRIILKDVYEVYYPNLANPFEGVRIESIGDEEKRPPFTEEDVLIIREIFDKANCDDVLRAIAAIAENTGASPKELVLLEPADIVLDAEIPHIIIRPNSFRRRGAKTKHRHREIPLIGRALEYAKKYPNGFEKYRRVNGSEAAGRAINDLIKGKTSEGTTFYSYRHRIAKLLLNSGYDENMLYTQPSETMKNSIMGHEGGIQKYYGDGYHLKNLYTALRKALPEYA